MGSATREAVAAAKAALPARPSAATLAVGEEIFAAGRVIGDSASCVVAAHGSVGDLRTKAALVSASSARSLHERAISSPGWREAAGPSDRTCSPESKSRACGSWRRRRMPPLTFDANSSRSAGSQLECGAGTRGGQQARRPRRQGRPGRATARRGARAHSLAIVRHLVQQPRGRRIGAFVRHAADRRRRPGRPRHRHGDSAQHRSATHS